MSHERIVIIGGGHAAAQLAASLRSEGWTGPVSLVSAEPSLPYHRPPLSKTYLAGAQHSDEILIRPAHFYANANIDTMLGVRVTAINRAEKYITLHNGARLPYQKLALATGAVVRKIAISGAWLDGVLYLREMEDAERIREYAAPGKRAVILGGGYTGLETAASLRKLGMEVTVVEASSRVLQRVTAPEVSEFYTRIHQEEGVEILTGSAPASINGKSQVESVTLQNGQRISADLVICGIGVLPADSLAEDAGLKVDNGICVDEFGRTSDPDIVAAGDCTSHYNPFYDRTLRLESVQNATDQAKAAAKTLCGKLEPYKSLPWFWSDQYDAKLQIAGLSQGYDSVVVRGDHREARSFAAFYFQNGKLIAVDAINRSKEYLMARRWLAEGRTPAPERLADESLPVQELML
ncbi:MAG: NAD(P)/FAD-dependent oxidoreductase [Massilia sp.]